MRINKKDKEELISYLSDLKVCQGELGEKSDLLHSEINILQARLDELQIKTDEIQSKTEVFQSKTDEIQSGINKNSDSSTHSLEVMASLYNALLHRVTELNDSILKQSENIDGSSEYLLAKKMIKNKWKLIDEIYQEPSDMECVICGKNFEISCVEKYTSEDIYGGGTLIRYKCPHCGAIVGPNKMLSLSEDDLGEEYSLHYSVFSEGDTTEAECKTFYMLKPEKGKRYLNYGCGAWSKTIEKLRKEGFEVFGYDPYAPVNSQFIYNDFNQIKDLKFDGIFSHDLLEHLRHPIDTFETFGLLLNENGKMAHATACYRYVYEYTRFHLCFYTGDSTQKLCEKTRFRIVDKYQLPEELFYCYTYEKNN